MADKSNLKKMVNAGIQFEEIQSMVEGMVGRRNPRQLVTLCPQSGKRDGGKLVLSPFPTVAPYSRDVLMSAGMQ